MPTNGRSQPRLEVEAYASTSTSMAPSAASEVDGEQMVFAEAYAQRASGLLSTIAAQQIARSVA